jgi:DNA polymerase
MGTFYGKSGIMNFQKLLHSFDRKKLAVSIDFETYYDDQCSVKGTSYYGYTRHPKFDPYMVAIYSEALGIDYVGHPTGFDWNLISGAIWLAHNAAFDEIVYDSMVDHLKLVSRVEPHCWVDTAALCAFMGAPRNLAGASAALLGRKRDKTVRSDMKGKKFADVSHDEQQRWLEYARDDAVDCYQLWDKFGDRWPDREVLLSIHTVQCIKRGVYVDLDAIKKDFQVVQTAVHNAEKLIPWSGELVYTKTGKIKTSHGMPVVKSPTSTKELAAYCKDNGIPMPSTTAAKEKEFQEWEETYGAKFPVIRYIQTWRKCNRLVNLYEEMLGRVRPDGRMEFPFAYFGAGNTGRWSGRPGGGSHQGSEDKGINMQNLIKDALFFDKDCLFLGQGNAKNAPEGTDHIIEFRNRFIAGPGKKFVVSDLSQIEPRCLGWVTKDTSFLEACRRTSPYQAHAESTKAWSPEKGDLKKKDPKLYALSKAQVLALGYQAGWRKFIDMASLYVDKDTFNEIFLHDVSVKDVEGFLGTLTYCYENLGKKDLLEWENLDVPTRKIWVNSWKIVSDFREKKPKIKALWDSMASLLTKSASSGEDLEVVLPSGRTIAYRRLSKHDLSGEIIKGQRKKLYGGILVENLIQAFARDVFGECILNLERAGYPVIWHVHDEAIAEVEMWVAKHAVELTMTKTPDWCRGLPLAAEAVESNCYLK